MVLKSSVATGGRAQPDGETALCQLVSKAFTDTIRCSVTIDWTVKETAEAIAVQWAA